MHTDKALESLLDRRPFDGDAVDWVWPIEQHNRQVSRGRRLQAEQHGRLKGVVPAPDVGQIDDQEVETAQDVVPWPKTLHRVAVKADHWASVLRVKDIGHSDEVLSLPAEPVLRPKDRAEADSVGRDEQVSGMAKLAVHRGRVRHQADPEAAKLAEPVPDKHVEAGLDVWGDHQWVGNRLLEAGGLPRYNAPHSKHTARCRRREGHVPLA